MTDPLKLDSSDYVPAESWGNCKACGKYDDRRFGVCFDCSDFVVTQGGLAWHIDDPEDRWRVSGTGVLLEELQ